MNQAAPLRAVPEPITDPGRISCLDIRRLEVADDDPDMVMVRDTKDQGRGVMSVTPAGWAVFVEYAKQL
ncbi:DUF397 domain-containing protein [Streptomyces sp. MK7]|uniref:DUF397 domain-containing protein n=1 Tax=Streptomyces sp. MK7 TaxID=3067635 RepID=UPI00292FF23E|nr:DUF397 domain-containing protein [Streptomyces sp. MK7]